MVKMKTSDELSRNKKLVRNTYSSLLYQIVTTICGLILPRLILQMYGSTVNGLVNSIAQFLQFIAFMELGVGSVVESALYKPLADRNKCNINGIITSAEKFFRALAVIMICYVLILCLIYPQFVKQEFDVFYTVTLIIAMCISSFSQYYFGVVDRLLLSADQHGYIQYNVQTITLILNIVLCVVFMYAGVSIHVVKLTTSLVYLIRPIVLRIYVNNKYAVNRHISNVDEPIKQKWNGIAQHIASVVLENTDVAVLTLFSTLNNVSIYSIYHLVVYEIKSLSLIITGGMRSLLGELWAQQENEQLKEYFRWFEWIIHTGITALFSCTAILIVPFVEVYTLGINDVSYQTPEFAYVLVLANALHGLRVPYSTMILAGGHYKQTQRNYILSAIINIITSVIFVKMWGLIGVAIGTLISMLYQTVWMANYAVKNFICQTVKNIIKQFAIDFVVFVLGFGVTRLIILKEMSYVGWIIMAIKVCIIIFTLTVIANYIFYKDNIFRLLKKTNLVKKKQL